MNRMTVRWSRIAAAGMLGIGCAGPAAATTYQVSNASALLSALTEVKPGDTISLASGTYSGNFVATRSGVKGQPIVLSGPTTAVLTNSGGYGCSLQAD